jgi:hypothetical protein
VKRKSGKGMSKLTCTCGNGKLGINSCFGSGIERNKVVASGVVIAKKELSWS